MNDSPPDPNSFSHPISATDLQLWREALAHLRYLSDDVWKGLKLYLGLNVFFLASMVAVAIADFRGDRAAFLMALLALGSGGLTVVARYNLKRNRIYYLQMLLKKSLLEDQLGFYQKKFSDSETDLAFPWRLTPEVIAELKTKPEEWIHKSIRGKGTIARWQFFLYDALLLFYVIVFVKAIWLIAAWRLIEMPVPS